MSCNVNLNGIELVYLGELTGASFNYFYSGNSIIINDSTLFKRLEDIDDDLTTFNEKKVTDAKGTYYNQGLNFLIRDYLSDTPHNLLNKSFVVLLKDSNGYWLGGYEQPFSIDKIEDRNDDKNNQVEFNITSNSYFRLKPLYSGYTNNCSIEIDSIDVFAESLSAYTVKINTSNGSDYITYNFDGEGYQSSNTFSGITAGTYSVLVKDNLVITPCIISDSVEVGSDFNSVFNLSADVDLNDIVLSWENPSYTVPINSFKIVRTNPMSHPSGATTTFIINSSSLTGYTDSNVGSFGGTYTYWVAPCEQAGGTKVHQYKSVSQAITNYNIPENFTGSTSGNDIILTWTNPAYTVTVQSFSINRLNPAGHPDGSSTVLTFNNSGTGTTYTDVNVGQYPGTYQYQIAVAKLPNGFSRETYTYPLISIAIANTNVAPVLWFTTGYTLNKYYGSYSIAPQLHVSGGTGQVTMYWKNILLGISTGTSSQVIHLNGSSFNTGLTAQRFNRGYDPDVYTFNVQLQSASGYTIGGANNNISVAIQYLLPTPFSAFTVTQIGANVKLDWSEVTDPNTNVIYGYVVNRFLTSNFGTNTVLAYVAGNTTLTYTDVSAPLGDYTYYVRAASINGDDHSYYTSDVSDLKSIIIV